MPNHGDIDPSLDSCNETEPHNQFQDIISQHTFKLISKTILSRQDKFRNFYSPKFFYVKPESLLNAIDMNSRD